MAAFIVDAFEVIEIDDDDARGRTGDPQRRDELFDAVAIEDARQRIDRRELLVLLLFMRELGDLLALRAMRATQAQPLRSAIRGAEDHPQAQDSQVPIFRADSVAD